MKNIKEIVTNKRAIITNMTLTLNEYNSLIQDNSLIVLDELSTEIEILDALTLTPSSMSKFVKITLDNYKNNFTIQNKVFDHILKDTTNVVVVGGAAFKALYPNRCLRSDIDIFIYGIFEEQLIWTKVNEIVNKIFSIYNGSAQIEQYIKGGLVIIMVSTSEEIFEYQIILNIYKNIHDILSKFDLPCCSIAYDGQNVYMTKAGAYSHITQTNVLQLNYITDTYSARLKKYFDRGFGIVCPEYDINRIENNNIIINSKLYAIDVIHCKNNTYCGYLISICHDQHEYSIMKFTDFPDFKVEHGWYLSNTKKINYIEFGDKTTHEIIKDNKHLLSELYKKIVMNYILKTNENNVLETISTISKINIDNLLQYVPDYKPKFIHNNPLGNVTFDSYEKFYSL